MKSIFLNNFNQNDDEIEGYFSSIKKQTTNLKSYFYIETNSPDSFTYENIIGPGNNDYQGFLKTGQTILSISFKKHFFQVYEFVLGQPFNKCYALGFNLIGKDEKDNEVDLGFFNMTELGFCADVVTSNEFKCQRSGNVTFKVMKGRKSLLKSISFVATQGSCSIFGTHIAMRGIELFGNLFKRYRFFTSCKKTNTLSNTFLSVILCS